MLRLTNIPIRLKVLVAIVGTTSICLLITALVFVVYNWFSVRETLNDNLSAVAEVFSLNTTAALSFNDATAASEMLSSLQAKHEVLQACLYKHDGTGQHLFSRYARDNGSALRCPDTPPSKNTYSYNYLEVVNPVILGNERIGSIYIARGLSDLWASTRVESTVVGIMVLASIAMASILSLFLQRFLSNPIVALLGTIKKVSTAGDYSHRATPTGNDEIGELIVNFNNMLSQIESKDIALEAARAELELRIEQSNKVNFELERALKRLKETQEQLVNNEKMASLGGLVAGVAHEINTPVGIGVTAASTLREDTKSAFKLYDEGELTNSSLRRYFGICMQATEIILGNLQRAADLIHSFKQVAVDQSSSEYRVYELKKYIDETFLSLKPKLRSTNLNVEINCDPSLTINSVPGAMSQIITNLVMNSVHHAYEEGQKGCLRIVVESLPENILIHYSDDGKGMPPEVVAKVFDPFFTTRRGAGGSGLGMHIVYNLVTQQLKGTVKIRSILGQGSSVHIVIPT
ncbi:ATP-binding protein [Zhongshania sp. BJYM1]|uniref:ATP-binding protein n=1 Tax=Zhongshania aquatica TaxID=2965069 RepID=UPI0022B52240|nr:ATP-binding protein [Marortus sp. BJYM1]